MAPRPFRSRRVDSKATRPGHVRHELTTRRYVPPRACAYFYWAYHTCRPLKMNGVFILICPLYSRLRRAMPFTAENLCVEGHNFRGEYLILRPLTPKPSCMPHTTQSSPFPCLSPAKEVLPPASRPGHVPNCLWANHVGGVRGRPSTIIVRSLRKDD